MTTLFLGARRGAAARLLPTIAVALSLIIYVASLTVVLDAQQPRSVKDGIYTDAQAGRGQQIYQACAPCHAASLQGGLGPPLTGESFIRNWSEYPLWDLATKIGKTMPQTRPGSLTPQQTADVVAYLIKVGGFPAGQSELGVTQAEMSAVGWTGVSTPPARAAAPAAGTPAFPPVGTLAQVMRGILFPSSNIIFNAQGQDPSAEKTPYTSGTTAFSWADWGAGIYSGWEMIDFAAISISEAAPLLLTPGRRCENGRSVPVERQDWNTFTRDMVSAGRAAYRASQTRNRDAVIESTNQLASSCENCHMVYRDKPGGTQTDPSNKAARCVP